MSFKQAILQILSLALPIMGLLLQLAYNTADIFAEIWEVMLAAGTAGSLQNLAWSTNIISVGAGKTAQSIGAKI